MTQAGGLHYGYDANGNLTSITNPIPDCISVVRLMRWDAENRLAWLSNGSETISYQYDADGSRIRRSGPSVGTTHYFGKVAEVQDPGGSPVLTKYYYAGDLLVARQQGGTKQFYHQDHLDSVRALSDASGAQVVRYEYAAFGEEIEKVGTSDDPHGFGAHRLDPESGLLYMGARYQDPVLGRFTQPDQVVPEAGDPQSWNRYSFVRNNPFNRIDPTGREDLRQRFSRESSDEDATIPAEDQAVEGPGSQDATGWADTPIEALVMATGEALRGEGIRDLIRENNAAIEDVANTMGHDPHLIRALIFEEQSHLLPGEAAAERLGYGNTVGLGQVTVGSTHHSRADLFLPRSNIQAIGIHISRIKAAGLINPGRPVASIGTAYNAGLGQTSISAYGNRVEAFHARFSSGFWR